MIIRRKHTAHYTVVGNAPLNDRRLSAEALGVLVYLLGRPDDWKVMPEQLAERFDCGRDRIRRIIGELVDAGYIVRQRVRDEDSKAFTSTDYWVYDEPQGGEPRPEKPSVAPEPRPEKPALEKPSPENPALLNTDLLPITDRDKKPKDSWPDDATALREFWSAYPPGRKTGKAAVARKLQAIRRAGVSFDLIMAGVRRYAATKPDPQYTKGPLVWLNQGCWDDEITVKPGGGPTTPRPGGYSMARMLAEHLQNGEDSDDAAEESGQHTGSADGQLALPHPGER